MQLKSIPDRVKAAAIVWFGVGFGQYGSRQALLEIPVSNSFIKPWNGYEGTHAKPMPKL